MKMRLILSVLLLFSTLFLSYQLLKFRSGMARGSMVVLKNIDFEVFGKVQGVFFRKHTRKTASQYGLVGWVQNTNRNTVIGQAQGPLEKVDKLKEWLKKTGSPYSSISKAEFKNEKVIDSLSFTDFEIVR